MINMKDKTTPFTHPSTVEYDDNGEYEGSKWDPEGEWGEDL